MSSPIRYDQYGFEIVRKPPRPKASTGAILLMVGGAVHIIGVFLPWYQGSGIDTLKGMDTFAGPDGVGDLPNPGLAWLAVGAILIGLGAATYFAGRIIGIACAAVFMAIVVGGFSAILGWGAIGNEHDAGGAGDVGAGVIVGTLGILIAIAGSIQVLAKRRR
ncbi:MAG: hypothetical protein JWL72_1044 [Ilumatobacteraceae bacterium]|nr:hypothetical protein [Ilumatobacteraceae bacterium]